jgi:hypothetical protein
VICATCCATKRLVEIRCPSDCLYLESASKHPAAAVKRQQAHDLGLLLGAMEQRLSEMQLQLFLLLAAVIVRHKPEGLATLVDRDVADAAEACAGTLEAASHGVIAELTGASVNGEALRREFKGLLDEAGKGGGSRFEREAAEVLRGIERGARHQAEGLDGGDSGYLTALRRVLPPQREDNQEGRIILG